MAVLSRAPRALWLDVGRGGAILAMIVYHFAFDLALFGFVDWNVAGAPHWRGFAAAIASTFLFLSGVSLSYAHAGGVRWRAFLRRLAVIGAAAAAVTVASVTAAPAPVYFGILHAIALFSVLALPFLFAPAAVTALVAAVVLVLPHVFRSEAFLAPWGYPFGLAPMLPFTMDYEPIFPWFAATLLGVAYARIAPRGGGGEASGPLAAIERIGRHSLAIYLVHQPVLFAFLIAVGWLVHRG